MAHRIAVQAGDARLREKRLHVLLDLFSPGADKIDVFGIALGAKARNRAGEAAIVAGEALALFVKGERDAAILTEDAGATAPAEHKPRISAPVDEDNGLPAGGELPSDCEIGRASCRESV